MTRRAGPPRRSRPSWSGLAVMTGLAVVGMLGALAHVLIGVGATTERLADARIVAAQNTNGQRDLLLFHQAVVRLAVGGSMQDVELRRALALQQLKTLSQQEDGAQIVPMQRLVRSIDPRRIGPTPSGHEAMRRTDASLTVVERRFKEHADIGDQAFQRLVAEALSARMNGQRWLGALIALSLLSAGAWMVRSLRRSRGDVDSARRAALRSEARFETLVRNSSDLTLLVGADGAILYASPAAREHVGWDPKHLEGRSSVEFIEFVDERDRAAVRHRVRRIVEGETTSGRLTFRADHVGGQVRHLDATITDLRADPAVRALVFNIRDVTERTLLEAQLSEMAFTDPLTGLANRALLHERIAHASARSHRSLDRGLALILIDLDDFKAVNDGLGHAEGDRLLQEVAGRLSGRARAGDTVARLGGDEFVVLAEDVPDAAAAAALTTELLRAVQMPLSIGSVVVPVSASAGVRHISGTPIQAADLLRDADLAMYAAKARGKGTWTAFDPGMQDSAAAHLELLADLHGALARDELVLHFQPVVEVASGCLKGFEALVRWNHPKHGLLGPDRFIGPAEDAGVIHEIGAWVMREALAAGRRMRDASGRTDLTMNVNLSPRQLERGGVTDLIQRQLAATGFPADGLVVEVTENVFLSDTATIARRLDDIRALGVRVALDDFGTGFSSLSYIERLPLDVLKIDRSFVRALGDRDGRAALVATIVQLGQALGLRTVAEGVETSGELAALRTLGCDDAQGYLFARALPEADAAQLLLAGEPVVA